ncbi:hypothetical protein D3C78_1324260 [compost metagenome]
MANAASRHFAPGRAGGASAAEQQFYQSGKRYLTRRDDSGTGVVPSGAADYVAHAGSFHHVSGRLTDLLGNGNRAVRAAKLF